jgi:hypothetical protein
MMDADVVRHLCLCPVCGKLGDEWVMVRVGPMGCLSHDRCVFEQLGEGILNLPKEEQAKFTLAAVGPDMMRRPRKIHRSIPLSAQVGRCLSLCRHYAQKKRRVGRS